MANGEVAVAYNLIKRGIKIGDTCQTCGEEKETQPHLIYAEYHMYNGQEMLNFFVGWKIWRMRNNIIFQNKRDHIIHVVHGALRD
ncbi:unnamed protein product, partial [Brassica oleracea var. botrytis]